MLTAASAVLSLKRAIAWDPEQHEWFEKDTKTHQQRRVALAPATVELLAEHHARSAERAAAIGVELSPDAFVFSLLPDGSTFLVPSSVSQRYDRMVGRLGIDTTLHKLRHYSATELISAGVDVRTVAGRLGHGSGGNTTLRVYSAWVSEADQRASTALASRVPERPQSLTRSERAKTNPKSPYEKLAAKLREQILHGKFGVGDELPSVKEFAAEQGVSVGTAQRAFQLLKEWGLVEVIQGRRATVAADVEQSLDEPPVADAEDSDAVPGLAAEDADPQLLEFEVRRLGESVRIFKAEADPTKPEHLRRLLAATVRRDGRDIDEILDYEMDVCRPNGEFLTTFVSMPL